MYLSDKLFIRYLTLIPCVYPCLFVAEGWRLECGEVTDPLAGCLRRACRPLWGMKMLGSEGKAQVFKETVHMLCKWLDATLRVLPSRCLPTVVMDLNDRVKSLPNVDGPPVLGEWIDSGLRLVATEVLKVMQKNEQTGLECLAI